MSIVRISFSDASWTRNGPIQTRTLSRSPLLYLISPIAQTLLDVVTDEDPLKVAHLVSLAGCLLSPSKSSSTAPLLTKLLGNDDDPEYLNDGPKITMKELRQLALQAGTHKFFWTEISGIPPHKFVVGDFGYVPKDKAFANFVKLGNMYSDKLANIIISAHTYGSQFCWEDRPIQHVEMQSFCLPDDVYWYVKGLLWRVLCMDISLVGQYLYLSVLKLTAKSNIVNAWATLLKLGFF